MLKMKRGSIISNSEVLNPEYTKTDTEFIANVNVENISVILEKFISLQSQELFFFIEVPTNLENEKSFSDNNALESLHADVYYIDGISKEKCYEILKKHGEILINDGLCEFGFGTRSFEDEIMCRKYNIVAIYTQHHEKYNNFFEVFNINQNNSYKSAWDYFSMSNPGISKKYEINGKNIYLIIEELTKQGLYFAGRKNKD